MKILMYQVDAFTGALFGGNPAAVCPLTEWLPDDLMQKIAEENNLSETAFFINDGEAFRIRWFTPRIEIDLAGHPTLAAAHVIFNHLDYARDQIPFICNSGELKATRRNELIQLNFPAHDAVPTKAPETLTAGLGHAPREVFLGRDYIALFESEEDILALRPDFAQLAELDCLGIIVTAPGKECDFVSRFFAPRAGINEDPVTGSAHTLLIPLWAKRLGKSSLHAWQVSKRRGELFCEHRGDRVFIGGRAVTFFEATVTI
jgi:predicted PhzF superfamily epimerase YddE/YHI9